GTGGTQRVTQRDGAAPRVDLVLVQLQLTDDREGLGGEGLVDLDGVDGTEVPAGALEHLAGGRDRAEAHDLRGQARVGVRDDPGTRLETVLLDGRLAHHEDRGGTVVEGGGVAGGDDLATLDDGAELRQDLRGGAGARALIGVDEGDVALA